MNKEHNEGYQRGFIDASIGIPPRFTRDSDFGQGYLAGYQNFRESNPEQFEEATEEFKKRTNKNNKNTTEG